MLLRCSALFALAALALFWTARPVAAVDVTCIESSRYTYLYQLFGGDQRRFAAYFNLDPARLPPPMVCRAALVSGTIVPRDDDAMKLIDMIARNGGWLDTLYLDSTGGNVRGGVLLALVTRAFWLKTRVAPPGVGFVFDPDFGPPAQANPPDPGRMAFDRGAAAVATRNQKPNRTMCASACTYTLAAGLDRHGIARVHRPRNFNEASLEKRAGAERAEALMMGVYKKMDVGDAFMNATRETATQSTSAVVISRFPRFIEDALLDRCKSDAAQLDDLAALLRFALGANSAGLASMRNDALKDALAKVEVRRQAVAQCVSVQYETERLAAFARLCPAGCNPEVLGQKFRRQLEDLRK